MIRWTIKVKVVFCFKHIRDDINKCKILFPLKVTILYYIKAKNLVDKEIHYLELNLKNYNVCQNKKERWKVNIVTGFGVEISLKDMLNNMSIRNKRVSIRLLKKELMCL